MKVSTRKTTKSEAKILYNELIQKGIHQKKKKSNDTRKYNILNILNNVGSIFTNLYFHYKDEPKGFERSIAEKNKIKKRKIR